MICALGDDVEVQADVLVAKLERATRLIPMFRQHVVEPPARLATPRWTMDGSFDLTWHLRRMDSPAPHTPDTVVALARIAAMTAFDRSRPLWEFTLEEHLEEDRAALVMKLHRSPTDGLGGMQLALLLFDLEPIPTAPAFEPDGLDDERLGTGDLLRQSLNWDWERFAGLLGHSAGSAAPSAVRAARHPLSTVRGVVETARSIGRTVAPRHDTLSSIMTQRGLGRHLEMLEITLGDLKRTLPISIRTPEDPMGETGSPSSGLPCPSLTRIRRHASWP